MKSYKDLIDLLETSDKGLFAPVFYITGRTEWLPVDKVEYLRQIKMFDKPETIPLPCYIEIESDGEVFIHPRQENGEETPKSLDYIKHGEIVKFRLDGKWDGEGKVIYNPSLNYETHLAVELTQPCKEYTEGMEIFVAADELL